MDLRMGHLVDAMDLLSNVGADVSQSTVLLGDCRTVAPVSDLRADVMITDPPYSAHVHRSAVSQSNVRGVRKREFGFDSLTSDLREYVAGCAAKVKRWSVIYTDVESVRDLRDACTGAGATYVRTIPWVRWSMPQLSGDRPPTGWEALVLTLGEECETVVLHWGSQHGKKSWNGQGNLTHLAHKCLRGEGKHRAEKPLDQALDLVSWFSNPGETVFDPFSGSGTVGVACRLLGRNYIGVEHDASWHAFASGRIESAGNCALSKRDNERLARWRASQELPT